MKERFDFCLLTIVLYDDIVCFEFFEVRTKVSVDVRGTSLYMVVVNFVLRI